MIEERRKDRGDIDTGSQAREIRQALLRQRDPLLQVGGQHAQQGKSSLRAQAKYKHLGCVQECGGMLRQEIHMRTGHTWQGFRDLRRLLCNPRCQVGTRLGLMRAYGSGAWGPLSKKQVQQLDRCYMNIVRAITGQVFTKKSQSKPWSNARIRATYLIPDIQAAISTERLL